MIRKRRHVAVEHWFVNRQSEGAPPYSVLCLGGGTLLGKSYLHSKQYLYCSKGWIREKIN